LAAAVHEGYVGKAIKLREPGVDIGHHIRGASILKDGRAVFNIAGNKYRIVCGSIIPIGSSMSGSSARTGSTIGSMYKPYEGRSHGHRTNQDPA
jgi:hypothetical protein